MPAVAAAGPAPVARARVRGANPIWIYDPSGTITDGVDPIAGATVTLTRSNARAGPYSVWDAAAYEQDNDQVTGACRPLRVERPGGVVRRDRTRLRDGSAGSSKPLQVLPPRTGIDLVLGPNHLPSVTSASAAGDVVTVAFEAGCDKFLTGSQLTLTGAGRHPGGGGGRAGGSTGPALTDRTYAKVGDPHRGGAGGRHRARP